MSTHEYFKTLDRRNSDSIKWVLAKKKCNADDCLTFSIADSDYPVPPPVKAALAERVNHGAFGYAGVGPDYKEIVAAWHKERYGLDIDQQAVVPAHSVLNALSMLIQTHSRPGERILIQPPVYHVFRRVIESNDRVVRENRLMRDDTGYHIDFDDLEKQFQSGIRILVLCSPHNPVGRVWTQAELKRLVDMAKNHDAWIFSDEIHADVIMPGHAFVSVGSFFDQYDRLVAITAPSKTFNIAGLQIANVIATNKVIRDAITHRQQALHLTSPNLMAVTALKAAYQRGVPWLCAQNEHIRSNYEKIRMFVGSSSQDLWLAPLEGTYLAWMDVSASGMDSVCFTKQLAKEEHVVLADGRKFGDDAFVRINLACSEEQLEEGLHRLKRFMT